MNFNSATLLFITIAYLFFLFWVANAAEKKLIPERIVSHPFIYVLALGVYASGFAYFGITGLAAQYGIGYLNYYLGICAVFFLTPVLIRPLYHVCKTYRLSSIADLLSFRYRSQAVGGIASIIMALAMLPLIAIQIEVVAESASFLFTRTLEHGERFYLHGIAGLLFCILIAISTVMFGSRTLNARDSHRGLIAALAFESVIKLIALLVIGAVASYAIFGSWDSFREQFLDAPQSQLPKQADQNSLRIMFISFFGMALALPSAFQLLYAEESGYKKLRIASWGLPLFLLAMSLPIAPLLWAARSTGFEGGDYAVLHITQYLNSDALALIVFLGGLSAASGTIMVSTLSLASMTLTHLFLPLLSFRKQRDDVYNWLLRARQTLIVLSIFAGFVLYLLLPHQHQLSTLMLLTTSGCAQLGPAIIGVLYWPTANRRGAIYGMITGGSIWLLWLLIPSLGFELFPRPELPMFRALYNDANWVQVTSFALVANSLVFALTSLFTKTSREEKAAAATCNIDDLNRPGRSRLNLSNAREMGERLSEHLGHAVASQELGRALTELNLLADENRPYALRRLRDQIEVNLSGLMGPSIARRIIDNSLPYTAGLIGDGEDITLIETRLETYQANLTGLAADLDSLRRYHRETLEQLPIGVCSLGSDQEILLWNKTMSAISGVASHQVLGSSMLDLPDAWANCLLTFGSCSDVHWSRHELNTPAGKLWLNLHKTESQIQGRDELIIVVEDITDTQLLESELTHQERLASIGRLAAGVAHEIGNPVTGIACLAQNLRYESDNPDTLESAEQIVKQTQRITSIVQSLVNFAHTGSNHHAPGQGSANVQHCAEEAIQLLSLDREAKHIQFENRCDPQYCVQADTQRLVQVFVNLLSNARDASPNGSVVTIAAELAEHSEAHLQITVTDQGEGIDQSLQDRLFEPFFTTKEPGKGTGLGLALVYSIVKDFSGTITIESPLTPASPTLEPPHGTRVWILLPLATDTNGDTLEG
ncbi:PAS domain S-box protein [Spongiibacter sp. KMU-158]|uniref:histidine kinase n=1 Tax=Spongiibacter pelagi TaxID=2760804 RepID=A0A927C2C6_9GAMM|nr:ATP-binding protein [Spongiibacter pelagi]MBD2860009.1 PAS domain S-box protein [Spongiibacter pelagi]